MFQYTKYKKMWHTIFLFWEDSKSKQIQVTLVQTNLRHQTDLSISIFYVLVADVWLNLIFSSSSRHFFFNNSDIYLSVKVIYLAFEIYIQGYK